MTNRDLPLARQAFLTKVETPGNGIGGARLDIRDHKQVGGSPDVLTSKVARHEQDRRLQALPAWGQRIWPLISPFGNCALCAL